jgi:hypothetical protein
MRLHYLIFTWKGFLLPHLQNQTLPSFMPLCSSFYEYAAQIDTKETLLYYRLM